MIGWKSASATECLKWRVDNPGQEAMIENGHGKFRVQYDSSVGQFLVFEFDEWCLDETPGSPDFIYFIPEVTK